MHPRIVLMNRSKTGTNTLAEDFNADFRSSWAATAAKSTLKVTGWRELKKHPNLRQIKTRLFS
jgi:hypothetical protein